jgi:hypothetical protein
MKTHFPTVRVWATIPASIAAEISDLAGIEVKKYPQMVAILIEEALAHRQWARHRKNRSLFSKTPQVLRAFGRRKTK